MALRGAIIAKYVPYGGRNFKDRSGTKLQIIKHFKPSKHSETAIPSAFYSFPCLISFTRISRGQSHHKSGSLNNKYEYHSKHPKLPANVRTPSVTSSEPLPKGPENPSGATADFWPGPPRPPQRSAARPRRHGLSQPQNAAASRLGRRGCDADGGAAAAAVEKQSV